MEADVAIYVFWAWLAISLAVVVVQTIRRARFRRTMRRRETEAEASAAKALGVPPSSAPPSDAPPSDAPPSDALRPDPPPSAGPPSAGPPSGPAAPLAPPADLTPPSLERAAPSHSATPEPTGAPRPAAEPDRTAIRSVPAPPTPEPSVPVAEERHEPAGSVIDLDAEVIDADPAGRATVGDLLSGVSLPHDLLPTDASTTEAVRLSTEASDAAAVGSALADELEARGFAFEALGRDRAEAHREGEVLSLQIRPRMSGVEIDVWSGSRPNPFLSDSRC